MKVYFYKNLPINKLVDNYSIWYPKNSIVYIKLFSENSDALMELSDNYSDIAILMSKNLSQELAINKKKDVNYDNIYKYIIEAKDKINNLTYPIWDFFEERVIDKNIKHTEFDISINKILSEIFELIKLHCGDPIQISNIIKNIKLKFDISFEENYFMDELIQKTSDNVFLLVNIRKCDFNSSFKCISCISNKQRYLVKYLLIKPSNSNALEICQKLVNNEIKEKIKYIKDYI